MPRLSIETIAIVEATTPDVQAQAAAITFRMWHHLPSEATRHLLLAEVAIEGRVVGLIEAISAMASRKVPQARPRLLLPIGAEGSASFRSAIEPALMLALSDALGKLATSGVLNAWKQAFRFLTEQLAR